MDGFNIQMLRYGKKQFLKSVKEGIPVNLISLKFGKVLYDNDFFSELKKKGFQPTEKTIERWVSSAAFNLGDAAMNYSFPTCISEYFKSLRNAARGFCSILILKEKGIVVDGIRMILDNLDHPNLCEKFRLVIKGKKEGKELKRIVMHQKIKASGHGKYLLAAEDIAIKALKISMGLNVPKANKLIAQLQKKYDIDHYHGFWLNPGNKELMLHMVLKGDRSGFFRYSLETGELIKADVPDRKGGRNGKGN